MSDNQKILSVIIPVFNETLTVGEILRRVCAVPIPKEIIVVDDYSTDGTTQLLRRIEKDPSPIDPSNEGRNCLRFIYQSRNQGKGAAIRTGLELATGEITIIQDADLEYDPAEYPKLLAPIRSGDADVVYGSRFRAETIRVHLFWHMLGNKLLTLLSNICTNLCLTDMETCYKAFKTDIIKTIPIRSNGFGFEPEITAKIAKLGCKIYEVPVSYHGRSYEDGKKIGWKDGFWTFWTILRFWVQDDLYEKGAGTRTLRIMEGAGAYNTWLFRQCSPFLGDRVLEVGSGVGNITRFLLNRSHVIASDISPQYVTELKTKYQYLPNVQIVPLDLTSGPEVSNLTSSIQIDTILSMNMLEHIQNDQKALESMYQLLPSGGRLVLLVPAHQWLYSGLDKNLDHFRRYSCSQLSSLLSQTGFKVKSTRYLNALGALAWFVNGRLLRRKLLPSRQLRLFDWVIVLLTFEKWVRLPFGLSVLAIAEKP